MSITIKDIATKCNVSVSTVSKVLNNVPTGVSAQTRERILKCIKETGYRPNSVARSLITKKTYTIGLIIPHVRNPYYVDIANGVEAQSAKCGYNVFLCLNESDPKLEKHYVDLLLNKKVDGIISVSGFFSKDIRSHVPLVVLERKRYDITLPSVLFNSLYGGHLAATYLLENNHRNILFITGDLNYQSAVDQMTGFVQCLNAAGVEVPNHKMYHGKFRAEDGVSAVDYFNKEGLLSDATAIFCSNDLCALGVYNRLYELNYAIPDDISVMGYDDISISKFFTPPLTTIAQSTYEMGKAAFNLLMDLIDGNYTGGNIVFDPSIVVRKSVKKL